MDAHLESIIVETWKKYATTRQVEILEPQKIPQGLLLQAKYFVGSSGRYEGPDVSFERKLSFTLTLEDDGRMSLVGPSLWEEMVGEHPIDLAQAFANETKQQVVLSVQYDGYYDRDMDIEMPGRRVELYRAQPKSG